MRLIANDHDIAQCGRDCHGLLLGGRLRASGYSEDSQEHDDFPQTLTQHHQVHLPMFGCNKDFVESVIIVC